MGSAAALKVLLDCAQAIQDADLKVADSLLERIWNLAAAESDENQKEVVKYFGEALVRRAYGLHPTNTYALEMPPQNNWCYDPTVRSLKVAINNGVMGKKRLHLIDFYVPHEYRWEYLFSGLPNRNSGDPVLVRVSVILPPFLEKTVNVQLEKHYLKEKAKEFKLELKGEDYFKVVYANSLGEVDDESMLDFRRTEDEAVVVYYLFKFQRLLADEGGAMKRELLKLRQINPEVVILMEQDANHNDSNFIRRLEASFQYYSLALPFWKISFSSCKMINYYRQQIGNIVGCEGKDRIVRHQNLVQWQSLLRYFGFLPIPIPIPNDCYYSSRFREENGCLVCMKENRPMFFVSAWKLTQSEDHFNPISYYYNFVQGSNPIPPEDIVQPLQLYPEGCLLNRFAARAEIYDMLEEICSKYELQLALTWACGTNVNEIMSDPYKKCKKRKTRILFMESTSCYVNHWKSQVFMKRCAELRLREGQAIAGKALQSSEDFHFEPSITKLKKSAYPLGAAQDFGSHAVVAVCLQNHYTIDDVYVVELFLETATKSEIATKKLASVIFNDLKNMKKNFVTLRVQGTEVDFQEDEIKAISIPPLEPLSSIPQGIILVTNPPPASLTANVLNSDTIGYMNTIELKDDHTMETRGLNEQGGVIPNFQSYSGPIYALLPAGRSSFNAHNSTSYNGVLETSVCEQFVSGPGEATESAPGGSHALLLWFPEGYAVMEASRPQVAHVFLMFSFCRVFALAIRAGLSGCHSCILEWIVQLVSLIELLPWLWIENLSQLKQVLRPASAKQRVEENGIVILTSLMELLVRHCPELTDSTIQFEAMTVCWVGCRVEVAVFCLSQDAVNGANKDSLLTNGLGMGEDSHVPVHLQGNGKDTSFEPNANNENEMVKANVNNLQISSAKRRKLTSKVWEEFTKEDGWATCAHCSRKFDGSSKKGTTHLRNHLERCKRRTTTTVRDQPLIFPATRDDSKNESVGEGNPSFDQNRSSMDFARMIIMHQCPLNMVEYKFFNNFLKNLQPMFKLQSQEALSSDILHVYTEEKCRLLEYFDKLSCLFNLTLSVWAHDLGNIIYCCYNVQFVDDNWELKKKILALKSFEHEFNTRIFYENFKNLLVDWNLDKKVCSLTIHNSSSSLEIAEEIRKSWSSFETSHPSSTFYIVSEDCIRGLLGKDISGENVDGVIKTPSACLRDIHDMYFRKPSQHGEKGYPLMNVTSDDINWRTCSLVLAIATVLDPRFKFLFVEFLCDKIYGNDQLTVIRIALTRIFNEYACKKCGGTPLFDDAEDNIMESFNRWDTFKKNVNTEASGKSELDKYLDQGRIISSQLEFNVLGWWSEHASSFPILGRMARDILAIPMSSILSGSTFNEKVMMDNPIFTGLDFQIIEAMICGRDWLEEAPKEISNIEPNTRLGNKGCPIVKLEDNPALAHHPELKRFSSESENEAPGNEDLGREVTTWTEKDVRTYLVSPFTDEELKHLRDWQNHTSSGEYVGPDKILNEVLKPLLLIPPPPDVSLGDAQKYYIDDRVVDQFFILLKGRYESFPHKYLKHYSFNSLNTALFINGSKTESEMLSWVKEEDLKGVRKLFLPICLHEHWLLFYVDIDDKRLLWLDSIEHSQMSNDLEKQKIRRWLLEFLLPSLGHDYNAKDWQFDVPKDIPSQKNSVDCALFVMKYADCLTHANYFPFTQDDMPHFRHRTFLDLCRGSLRLE
ncbi:hypothetical protein REPUB_Repub15cG0122000 [Reevesia pubescens]